MDSEELNQPIKPEETLPADTKFSVKRLSLADAQAYLEHLLDEIVEDHPDLATYRERLRRPQDKRI